MAFAFDTLGYAKRLRDAGVLQDQAEAHAAAGRSFIMAEPVTRNDLDVTRRELEGAIDRLALRLTVRLGIMLAGAVAILAGIVQLS